jgi:hypothetical protein
MSGHPTGNIQSYGLVPNAADAERTNCWQICTLGDVVGGLGVGGGVWGFLFRENLHAKPRPVLLTAALAGAGADASLDFQNIAKLVLRRGLAFQSIHGRFSWADLDGALGFVRSASLGVALRTANALEVRAWTFRGQLFSALFHGPGWQVPNPQKIAGGYIGSGIGRWSVMTSDVKPGTSYMPPAPSP